MCQVHTGAYVSLLAPGKTDYIIPLATQERLPRTYCTSYLLITTHTHDRRKSIEKKKQRKRKKRIRSKGKKRQGSEENEKGKERKEKGKKSKKRQDKKGKQAERKRKENVMLADPRN